MRIYIYIIIPTNIQSISIAIYATNQLLCTCIVLNSKKAICTTGWENGNAKSIFEIFSPTSPNGIYSYYNIKDIPFYHSPTDAYVTIIKGHELIIAFNEQSIFITGSSRNTWTKEWHSIKLGILS